MIFLRLVLTTVITIAAVFGMVAVWNGVFRDPWTRDAHVRANLLQIAPLVSGAVVEVPVRNNQTVKKGEVLMRLDRSSYELSVAQAEASLASARASAADDRQQADRLQALRARDSSAISESDATAAELTAAASAAAAQADAVALEVAKLDLKRTEVLAPADGVVTNLAVHVGDYAAAGSAAMAMIDTGSFRVDAFFMETQLERIAVGDPVSVRLMANGERLEGEVRGISPGISYSEDMSTSLLQAPEPSFQWIRLAQRIPVEVALKARPRSLPLANGMTASVTVHPGAAQAAR